jgi:hypothetical protein
MITTNPYEILKIIQEYNQPSIDKKTTRKLESLIATNNFKKFWEIIRHYNYHKAIKPSGVDIGHMRSGLATSILGNYHYYVNKQDKVIGMAKFNSVARRHYKQSRKHGVFDIERGFIFIINSRDVKTRELRHL